MEMTQNLAWAVVQGRHSQLSENEVYALVPEVMKAYLASANCKEDLKNLFLTKIKGYVHGKCCVIDGCQGNCGFAEKYPNIEGKINACFGAFVLPENTISELQPTGHDTISTISTEPTGESVCSNNDNSLVVSSAADLPGTPQHQPPQLPNVIFLTADMIPPATVYLELPPGTNLGTSLGNTSSQFTETSSLTTLSTMGTTAETVTVTPNTIPPNPEILGTTDYDFPVKLLSVELWEEIAQFFLRLAQQTKNSDAESIATSLGRLIYDFIFTEEEKVNCSQRPMKMKHRSSGEIIKTRGFDSITKELVYYAIAFAMTDAEKMPGVFFAALGDKEERAELSPTLRKHVHTSVFTNHASNVRAEKRKNLSGESSKKDLIKKTKN